MFQTINQKNSDYASESSFVINKKWFRQKVKNAEDQEKKSSI